MKRPTENLRLLLLLSAVSGGIGIALGFLPMPPVLPEGDELAINGLGAIVSARDAYILWCFWLLIYAISHLTAFLLIWWSKLLFLLSFALSIALSAVSGAMVSDAWSGTAWAIHATAMTFAVGILFFDPSVQFALHKDFRQQHRRRLPKVGPPDPDA